MSGFGEEVGETTIKTHFSKAICTVLQLWLRSEQYKRQEPFAGIFGLLGPAKQLSIDYFGVCKSGAVVLLCMKLIL